MFCISFHIDGQYSQNFDQQLFLRKVKSTRSPEIDAYQDQKHFHLSFHFFTEFPSELWESLQSVLFDKSDYAIQLLNQCVVTCEGESEKEYWLLHHFDKSQKLDTLNKNQKS